MTNIDEGLVRAVDTGSKQAVGPPINVGGGPYGIAVTPDGTRVYVANGGAVAVIDTQTNFVGPPITVGNNPRGIAISPDGMTAYVTNQTSGDVSVVDLPSNQAIGAPIVVGGSPLGIAITPNGGRAYVANSKSGSVSVIDTRTNQVVGSPIIVGTEPRAIAISPDGGRAYVANAQSGSVSVIDTGTNQVVGSPIIVGTEPKAIAITPDGARAYVANRESADVTVIDARTNQVVGSPIAAKNAPEAIAITPDQPPIAAFTHAAARPGAAVTFEASGSRDPDGTIARFDWNFGDGQAAPDVGPTPKHTYSRPGTLPSDADSDRQRGLLRLTPVHRTDRLLQRLGFRQPHGGRLGRLPGGSGQMPETRRAQRLQVQAHGGDETAQGQGDDADGESKGQGRALDGRLAHTEVPICRRPRHRRQGPGPGEADDQRLGGEPAAPAADPAAAGLRSASSSSRRGSASSSSITTAVPGHP